MVNIRTEGWKEMKVGLVAEVVGDEPLSSDYVAELQTRQLAYAAVLGEVSTFEPVLLKLAQETRFLEAVRSCITADGAAWIWNLAQDHFPDSLHIVDWYHARQHLHGAVAPGTSLGGARPKASVRDEQGVLCIAKFSSHQDTRDMGGWELVANSLAAKAGIVVPEARPLRLEGSPYTTFLAKRFDRNADGRRLAFVSAMTLTQHKDGESGASYLELVDLLQSRGMNTAADCEQLFRRVLFNILIHNTDDHLRNHGFFVDEQGIRLSPAYDMNPSIDRTELTLAINEVETACDVSVAMDASRDYGLAAQQASRVLDDVRRAVHNWRDEANRFHIPKAEQDLMASAFDS